jgi:hypothetical protein
MFRRVDARRPGCVVCAFGFLIGWPFCTCYGGVRQMGSIFICLSASVGRWSTDRSPTYTGGSVSALPLTRLGWGRVRQLPLISMDQGTSTTTPRLVLADGTFCYVLFRGFSNLVHRDRLRRARLTVFVWMVSLRDGYKKAWVPPYPSHADVLKHLNVLVSTQTPLGPGASSPPPSRRLALLESERKVILGRHIESGVPSCFFSFPLRVIRSFQGMRRRKKAYAIVTWLPFLDPPLLAVSGPSLSLPPN